MQIKVMATLKEDKAKELLLEYLDSDKYKKDCADNAIEIAYSIVTGGDISISRENLEALGFKYLPKGEESQSGDTYTNDGFEKYELGDFCPSTTYTILTVTDHGYITLYSNVHWIGDPSCMSTVFCGKNIETVEEIKKLLWQIGIEGWEQNIK